MPRESSKTPSKRSKPLSSDHSAGLLFPYQAAFESWLDANHLTTTDGIWLLLSKRSNTDHATRTLTYDEAVDAAICFGWMDSQRRRCVPTTTSTPAPPMCPHHFAQRFRPRRGGEGLWSKRNIDKGALLLTEIPCPIRLAGMAQIDAAKQDRRCAKAYKRLRDMSMSRDLADAEQARGPEAEAFFKGLARTRRYQLMLGVVTAKEERRRKRVEQIADMMAEGRTEKRPRVGQLLSP